MCRKRERPRVLFGSWPSLAVHATAIHRKRAAPVVGLVRGDVSFHFFGRGVVLCACVCEFQCMFIICFFQRTDNCRCVLELEVISRPKALRYNPATTWCSISISGVADCSCCCNLSYPCSMRFFVPECSARRAEMSNVRTIFA